MNFNRGVITCEQGVEDRHLMSIYAVDTLYIHVNPVYHKYLLYFIPLNVYGIKGTRNIIF